MKTTDLEPVEIGYRLRKPCGDCPFTRDSKPHRGVAADLPKYHEHMKSGQFAHSCHQTDSRSDYELAKRYKGKVQHCVGAIMFCEKQDMVQTPYLVGLINEFKHKANEDIPVRTRIRTEFTGWDRVMSMVEMVKKHVPKNIINSITKKGGSYEPKENGSEPPRWIECGQDTVHG